MSVLVIVPSRLGSTRFPRKVLAKLDGKPIVQWCWEAASAAGVGDVLIATEAKEVADAVKAFGGKAVMTSANCQSGTDRCFEAAKGRRDDIIVNVQGDQPFIKPATIRAVVKLLQDHPMIDIATAVMPLTDKERMGNPNVVKVAMNGKGRCLYFSRSLIPYPRNPAAATALRWRYGPGVPFSYCLHASATHNLS